MAIVKAKPGDTTDSLIRRFQKKVMEDGILLELKKREFYRKPSAIKKQKTDEIKRRRKK